MKSFLDPFADHSLSHSGQLGLKQSSHFKPSKVLILIWPFRNGHGFETAKNIDTLYTLKRGKQLKIYICGRPIYYKHYKSIETIANCLNKHLNRIKKWCIIKEV